MIKGPRVENNASFNSSTARSPGDALRIGIGGFLAPFLYRTSTLSSARTTDNWTQSSIFVRDKMFLNIDSENSHSSQSVGRLACSWSEKANTIVAISSVIIDARSDDPCSFASNFVHVFSLT